MRIKLLSSYSLKVIHRNKYDSLKQTSLREVKG